MSRIINDPVLCEVLGWVFDEAVISDSRPYPMDHLRRCALVCEEAGEALRAAINATRTSNYATTGDTRPKRRYSEDAYLENLRHELTQTVAMALKQLCAMEVENHAKQL